MTDEPPTTGPVDDRDVRAFLVVAEELHIGRAAARLGVTGSRVSQVISKLERRIGGLLLERSSRSVTLTPLGRMLHEEVAPALAALDRAVAETRRAAVGLVGSLVVGAYGSGLYAPSLRENVTRFERAHPAVSVTIRDIMTGNTGLDLLRAGDLDVIVLRLPLHDSDLVIGPEMTRESRVVLVASDHPLTAHANVTWEQVADYPVTDFPAFSQTTLDAFVPPRTASGRVLSRRLVTSFADISRLVAAGELVHPTVPSMADLISAAGFTTRPITDLPPSSTALIWLQSRQPEPIIVAFAALAAQVGPPDSRA